MGFWDIAKSIGSGIVEQMNQRRQRILEYQERYKDCDTDELIRIYRRSSGDKQYAIALLLRNKGVSSEDINYY